jgi:hypothetical protein
MRHFNLKISSCFQSHRVSQLITHYYNLSPQIKLSLAQEHFIELNLNRRTRILQKNLARVDKSLPAVPLRVSVAFDIRRACCKADLDGHFKL